MRFCAECHGQPQHGGATHQRTDWHAHLVQHHQNRAGYQHDRGRVAEYSHQCEYAILSVDGGAATTGAGNRLCQATTTYPDRITQQHVADENRHQVAAVLRDESQRVFDREGVFPPVVLLVLLGRFVDHGAQFRGAGGLGYFCRRKLGELDWPGSHCVKFVHRVGRRPCLCRLRGGNRRTARKSDRQTDAR